MLGESTIFATIAVSDIAAGKQFYGETLGLEQTDENPGGVTYTSGTGKLFVYQSPAAGKGQATCAAWNVGDIDAVVADLKQKGVVFEHYEGMPGEWDGDVLVIGNMKAGWFKDPDGNILSVGSTE
ncbi:VOC family protein [Candidatus Saccharibacteria bacterium]|nr:MAG: VOC family protein [Candidatus Saccharibacteria bacterium]